MQVLIVMFVRNNFVMKSSFPYKILSTVLFAFLFFSCSSNLDFDQVNDLKLEPAILANLAYFDVPANQLIDDGANNVIADVRGFDVFKEKFFTDRLKKAEFDIEIENTINRTFVVNMLLLNAQNEVLETISYTIPAYNGSSNVIKFPTEVFENQRLANLKQTVNIGFVVMINAGPPLNNSIGNLKLKSSATAYLIIG